MSMRITSNDVRALTAPRRAEAHQILGVHRGEWFVQRFSWFIDQFHLLAIDELR
jgi:hypothetical protein